ncbi:unnamed protein product [Cyprideis torosa]|uniref:Uncharacterized protein n=1 Tax=Cyprideis torosa TaxID=163714 RepID=A0A7R8WFD4_9CRUS|nr:unnamed protein product [Cyprideis torosa]CAG0891361.1 unnamed protein product [Cyprideis torosa]
MENPKDEVNLAVALKFLNSKGVVLSPRPETFAFKRLQCDNDFLLKALHHYNQHEERKKSEADKRKTSPHEDAPSTKKRKQQLFGEEIRQAGVPHNRDSSTEQSSDQSDEDVKKDTGKKPAATQAVKPAHASAKEKSSSQESSHESDEEVKKDTGKKPAATQAVKPAASSPKEKSSSQESSHESDEEVKKDTTEKKPAATQAGKPAAASPKTDSSSEQSSDEYSSRPRRASMRPPNIMATPGRRERFPPLESPTISRRPVRDDGSAHNRAVVSILDLPSTPPAADLRVSVGRSAHPATYCCELIRNGGRRGGTFNVSEWPIPAISLSIASTEPLRALEEELKTSKDSKKRQTHSFNRSSSSSGGGAEDFKGLQKETDGHGYMNFQLANTQDFHSLHFCEDPWGIIRPCHLQQGK